MDAMTQGQRLLAQRRQMGVSETHLSKRLQYSEEDLQKSEREKPATEIRQPGTIGGDVCPICKGLGFVRPDVPVNHPDFGQLKPCRCSEAEWRERRLRKLAKITGMLPEEMKVSFEDVIERDGDTARMVEAARAFVEEPAGMLSLHGNFGTGKTWLLYAIVNHLRRSDYVVAYVRFSDLLSYIQEGFNDGTEHQRYRFLRSVEVLAIDELDDVRRTAYREETIKAFLDYRYRLAWTKEAVTVLAFNCDPEEFPPGVYDRLRQFPMIENTDSSVRPYLGDYARTGVDDG